MKWRHDDVIMMFSESAINLFLRCPLPKYGHVKWPKKQISKKFYFSLILHLILGKVTKFLVEKLSISEVISQKPHGGGGVENTPPPCF